MKNNLGKARMEGLREKLSPTRPPGAKAKRKAVSKAKPKAKSRK
jgi:hypothetical protein